jgi:hypothetical protein
MRIAWRTVGAIGKRVAAEAQRERDLLAGLRRIGIDEISRAPRGAIEPGGMRGPPPVSCPEEPGELQIAAAIVTTSRPPAKWN